jgi:hypothetical protein
MTDQKPTGLFVPFPITDEQAQEMYRAYCAAFSHSPLTTRGRATQAALLAIATPIAEAQIAALEVELVRLREALSRSKRQNFNAGYLIACCNLFNMHNEEGMAADILAEATITEEDVKALGLSEYDAAALVEIRKARNEDPILKGGTA